MASVLDIGVKEKKFLVQFLISLKKETQQEYFISNNCLGICLLILSLNLSQTFS